MTANDKKFLKMWSKTGPKGKSSFVLKIVILAMFTAVLFESFARYELPFADVLFTYRFWLRITIYIVGGVVWATYMWNSSRKRYDTLRREESAF